MLLSVGMCLNLQAATYYIDYENGNDNNPGTIAAPFKHHPWDMNADGIAADAEGIHTYYFKKGVVYRGSLNAKESGTSGEPIRLTIDPTWGKGAASIYGSERITGKWKRCSKSECPEIPEEGREKTWYIDSDNSFTPRLLWEIKNNKIIRIPIARTPNWKIIDPDDPRSGWWELTGSTFEIKLHLKSTEGFQVGDTITGSGEWDDADENRDNIKKGFNRIVEVGNDYIRVKSLKRKKGAIKGGVIITNGRVQAKVMKLSGMGTHELISHLIDKKNLSKPNSDYYAGATMWAETDFMPRPLSEKVISYDPHKHSLRINYHKGVAHGPQIYDRYYLENKPQFLDVPGEYFYTEKGKNAGRLFLGLPDERNPNDSIIEVAKENFIIYMQNKSNIVISGLDFKFSNTVEIGTRKSRNAMLHASAINIRGNSSNIKIHNCQISHAAFGIVAFPEKKADILDYIEVSDNDIHDIDASAILLSHGWRHYALTRLEARLIHAKVYRNNVRNIGYRSYPHWATGIHTIEISGGELVEIADNTVNKSWGMGILAYNGDDSRYGNVKRPLIRVLIHHNKVTDSVLGFQDAGGINSWEAGPVYIYSNISGNPVGYKHAHFRRLKKKNWYRTSSYGVGIYLDGQYKGYVFNNILWGKNNNVNDRIYNSAAFNEAMGFMNTVFNNTMFRFGVGLHKGMLQHNRSYYIGNLLLDIGHKFIQHEPKTFVIEHNNLAYAKNVFYGKPYRFGQLGSAREPENIYPTLNKWRETMEYKKVMNAETGVLVDAPQVIDAEAHDFRLRADSAAIDNGAKVFVPWGLYAVVGEWSFYQNKQDPSLILGENMNWTDEMIHRSMFQDIPRNNLQGHNIDSESFTYGTLENWIKGALRLNGKNQYCSIKDSDLKKGYNWKMLEGNKRSGYYEGNKRVTVDMGTNNFLIEVVFRPEKDIYGGGIVSKFMDNGYVMDIDKNGFLRLALYSESSKCSRTSSTIINDGEWHHIIAEVDRKQAKGINLYIDGKLANGKWNGKINSTDSLSNTGDFLVGRTPGAGAQYFTGMMDFLRISRGTLTDAETTIQELYKWEFDGPFLKDFYGRRPTGKARDVGAIEYRNFPGKLMDFW